MASSYTKTEIANLAIAHVGGNGIATFGSEETEEGVQVNRWYDFALDETLKAMKPRSAEKRAALTQDATAPAFNFSYRYQLPTDYVDLLEVNDRYAWERNWPYAIEDGYVLSNDATCEIRYIFRQENEAQYEPDFAIALSHCLASKIARRLTGRPEDQQAQIELFTEYVRAYREPILKHEQYNKHRLDAIKECLTAIKPRFARKRDTLTEASGTPEHGYDHRYPLPSDYVTLLQVNNWEVYEQNAPWDIQGGYIHTDEDSCEILYIFNETTEANWDVTFANAVEHLMIHKQAFAKGEDKSDLERHYQLYRQAIRDAQAANATSNRPRRKNRGIESSWVTARLNSTNG